ncbi:DUF3291 domain-containing protein, partial [Aphanothece microscopica]|uniref:DUF3291 domain-containing protein n=1 Tax=Aphanothece microscopica TaxID=1049561 RepID=UPI0039854B6D
FVAMLGPVNALAERAPGFVWRLKDEAGAGATGVRVDENPRTILQLSLWETPEALEHFVWKTVHAKVYNRKAAWFPHDPRPNLAFWWQPAGTVPTATEAFARLERLRALGPTPEAFGWKQLSGAALWQDKRCG